MAATPWRIFATLSALAVLAGQQPALAQWFPPPTAEAGTSGDATAIAGPMVLGLAIEGNWTRRDVTLGNRITFKLRGKRSVERAQEQAMFLFLGDEAIPHRFETTSGRPDELTTRLDLPYLTLKKLREQASRRGNLFRVVPGSNGKPWPVVKSLPLLKLGLTPHITLNVNGAGGGALGPEAALRFTVAPPEFAAYLAGDAIRRKLYLHAEERVTGLPERGPFVDALSLGSASGVGQVDASFEMPRKDEGGPTGLKGLVGKRVSLRFVDGSLDWPVKTAAPLTLTCHGLLGIEVRHQGGRRPANEALCPNDTLLLRFSSAEAARLARTSYALKIGEVVLHSRMRAERGQPSMLTLGMDNRDSRALWLALGLDQVASRQLPVTFERGPKADPDEAIASSVEVDVALPRVSDIYKPTLVDSQAYGRDLTLQIDPPGFVALLTEKGKLNVLIAGEKLNGAYATRMGDTPDRLRVYMSRRDKGGETREGNEVQWDRIFRTGWNDVPGMFLRGEAYSVHLAEPQADEAAPRLMVASTLGFHPMGDLGRLILVLVLVGLLCSLVPLYQWNLLREPGPRRLDGQPAAFSFARVQMAFWTVLTALAYLYIWCRTGAPPAINAACVLLMGVGAATTVLSRAVDTMKSYTVWRSSGSIGRHAAGVGPDWFARQLDEHKALRVLVERWKPNPDCPSSPEGLAEYIEALRDVFVQWPRRIWDDAEVADLPAKAAKIGKALAVLEPDNLRAAVDALAPSQGVARSIMRLRWDAQILLDYLAARPHLEVLRDPGLSNKDKVWIEAHTHLHLLLGGIRETLGEAIQESIDHRSRFGGTPWFPWRSSESARPSAWQLGTKWQRLRRFFSGDELDWLVEAGLDRKEADQRHFLNMVEPCAASRGFWRDILGGAYGLDISRAQYALWMLLLGGAFLGYALAGLAFPEWGASTMALLGISAGGYVGYKLPDWNVGMARLNG